MSKDVNEMEDLRGLRGLKGIKGLSSLSNEDQENIKAGILKRVPAISSLPMSTQDYLYDRIYRDDLFVNKFGKDLYNTLTSKERDAYYADTVVDEYIQIYKDDDAFPRIKDMTTEGKLSLLESGYLTDKEAYEEGKKTEDIAEEVGGNKLRGFIRDLALASSPATRYDFHSSSIFGDRDLQDAAETLNKAKERTRQEILETALEKDDLRKVEQSSDISTAIRDKWQAALNSGELSYDEIEEQFEQLIGTLSPHYKAFKDSEIFKDYTISKKMDHLSKVLGVYSKFGERSVPNVINTEMQNYVADKQSRGDKIINTAKSAFLTKTLADLGNTLMGAVAQYKGAVEGRESLNKFLEGKDSNGEELPLLLNPLYYQGMDQFNTIDSNEIKKARENGGVSQYQNITRAGEEMKFFSEETLYGAASQTGYLLSQLFKSLVLKGGGKVLQALAPALKTSRLAQTAGAIIEIGASVSGMAEAEGLSSFQETLQQANSIVDSRLEEDTNNYIDTQLESTRAKELLQNKISDLKRLYSSPEFSQNFISEEGIKQEALRLVKEQLSNEYKTANAHIYEEDRKKALDAASLAYMTTATVFAAKEAITQGTLQSFLYNKGTRKALGDEGPKVTYRTLPDGTSEAVISKWEMYGKPLLKNPIIEGLEEISDSYVNALGQGVGLNEFNSYNTKKYNPEAYVEATDGIIGNILNGFTKANESLYEVAPYYEGFMAAISGVGEGIKNIKENVQFRKALNEELKFVNKIITEKSPVLNNITALLQTAIDANEAIASGDALKAIDEKHTQAFNLALTLNTLGSSEIGRQNDIYKNATQTIQELSEGTISEDKLNNLVTQFLSQPENKSLSNQPNAKEVAASLLKENATTLLQTQKEIEEVFSTLDNSTNKSLLTPDVKNELAYLRVAQNNWQKRLDSIEASLGGGKGTFNIDAEYGSKKAYERKKKALSETLTKLKESLSTTQSWLEDKKYSKKEKDAFKLKVKALKEAIMKTNADYRLLKEQESFFEENEYSRTLSREEILSLPAEQRAWILDKKNASDYSEEQQYIIEGLRKELTAKDPALLQQVQDAAILTNRISDATTAFSRIIDNPVVAINYIKELEELRVSKARSFYAQKAKEKVEDLFTNAPNIEAAQSIAKNLPYEALERYLKDHPEMGESLKGASEVSRLRQDAYLIGQVLVGEDDSAKRAIQQSIFNITNTSNNEEEAINAIEDAIDSDAVDAQTKSTLDAILNELQELNYQRNSTKVSDREAKKERQVAREKAAEEAMRKQEEALKIAEEEAKPKIEVPKDGTNLVSETMEDSGVSPDGSNIQETIEVDETKVGSEEQLVEVEDVDLIDRVESPTPEEQSKDNSKIREVQVTSTPEEAANTSSVILVGNAMYRYDGAPLKEDGYQVKRAGRQEGDPMNKFFDWMDSAGINYQEIIDNELHSILEANPKIQFLLVNPQDNATNDADMNDHVLEVVEYTPQVAKVHKESNGGVVTANGKRWLVIGTLGFGGYNEEQRKVYGDLKYELKKRRYQYVKANPDERFYVDPFYSTEVAKLDAGWITRKLVGDTEVKIRSIRELLSDEARNPRGLALEDLKWGIQSGSAFQAVGVSSRNKIHPPKDTLGNSGGAFLLVESANGEYIPIALKPVMYGELRDSKLKTEIDNLLVELTSPNHTERHTAISKLVQLLYLKENNILIGTKDRNTLSITKGDVVIKTFDLSDPTFNRMEFLESVTALNPRVNVTLTALSSPTTLEMLDEAGALLTDVAKLGTSNASFSVYNVGPDGKPIMNTPIENTAPGASDLRKVESSVLVLGQIYRKRKDGWVDAVDRVITDPRMLEQIRYNNIIQSSNLAPVATKDNQEYFIISQDMSNPVAVKRAIGTNTVTVASKEQALALIEQMAKKAAEKKAAEALSKATFDESSLRDVSLGEEVMTQEDIYSQMFGEFVAEGSVTLDETIPEETTPVMVEDINTTGTKSLAELQTGKGLSTLGDILGNSEYGNRLDEILDRKAMSEEWVDIPDDINLLGSYLRKKGIATSGITDVDSWLNMIDECK